MYRFDKTKFIISLPVYIYFIIRRIFLSLIKSSNIIIQISNKYL